MVIERISKAMTYGGACTAAGCGVANGAVETAAVPAITNFGDLGMWAGVAIGVIGLLIQGCLALQKWRHASEQRREERELASLKIKIEAQMLRKLEQPSG